MMDQDDIVGKQIAAVLQTPWDTIASGFLIDASCEVWVILSDGVHVRISTPDGFHEQSANMRPGPAEQLIPADFLICSADPIGTTVEEVVDSQQHAGVVLRLSNNTALTRAIEAGKLGAIVSAWDERDGYYESIDRYMSGASLLYTPRELELGVRKCLESGSLVEAVERLERLGSLSIARAEGLDLVRRMRLEYSLSEIDLLKKLEPFVPDISVEELSRWRHAGEVQFRAIDGQVCYFRREPSNIFRFCDEAKRRAVRLPGKKSISNWNLLNHLKQVVAAGESSGHPEVVPLKQQVIFRVTVPADTLGAVVPQKGTPWRRRLRLWLPYPQEYRQQTDVRLLRSELQIGSNVIPTEPKIAPNGIDGDPVRFAQRTAYFEVTVADPSKPIAAEIEFEYVSSAYYPKLNDAAARPLPADWGDAYLRERRPHLVANDAIRETVRQLVDDETNPLRKLRRIFYWCCENIRYHAEEEYCLLPSFSLKAFERRRGDCGVQTALFMTMCRLAGIPSRWQSGWETKPSGFNMHDWCEVYVVPWGWIPCDVSYGLQDDADPRIREFYIGHQDSHRLIVNLDYGRELFPSKHSLRSEPADFQRGEVELDKINLYFDQFQYSMRIFVDGVELESA